MNRQSVLANRLREVILDGKWIANTNFRDQLDSMDWEVATRAVGNLNTIALLAQHIHYYIGGIKEAFTHGQLIIRDRYSFDFAPMISQDQWESFLDDFWKDTEDLAILIETLPEGKLEEDFIKAEYGSYARNINGMIEHSYYHLGQVVLLKKTIETMKV